MRSLWHLLRVGAIAAALLALPAVASAQPVFDAASFGHTVSAATSVTFAHTVAGTNRALFCGAHSFSGITGITYNGDAMSELGEDGPSPSFAPLAIYRLIAPDVGTANVVATAGGSSDISVACVSTTNTHQTTPADALEAFTAGEDTDVPLITTASATGDLAIDFFIIVGSGFTSATAGSGQTERVDSLGAPGMVLASTEAGAASVTSDWTLAGGIGNFTGNAVSVNAAGGGAGATPPRGTLIGILP